MPKQLTQKTVNTFVGGLITEATELTYPENSSVDELNCELNEDGSRQRRNGIKVESGGTASTFSITASDIVTTHEWPNAGELGNVTLMVVQIGNALEFYIKGSYPVSGQYLNTGVSLNTFTANNGINLSDNPVQVTEVNGFLVVVHPGVEPFYLTFDGGTNTVTATLLPTPKVRDFEWQGDVSTYTEQVEPASDERIYDTWNAAWSTAEINAYFSAKPGSPYPPLTHPWYSGKNASGNFAVSEWEKVYAGTSLTGNGRFVLDLFAKDRRQAVLDAGGPDLSSILVESITARFSTCTTFAGRVWMGGLGNSRVYFSKVVERIEDATVFHQQNDPTGEDFSDLVDDDGGVVVIGQLGNVKKLFNLKDSLFIFAENGIWEIKGVDGVFKATEFAVSKISKEGLFNAQSFVDAEGTPFWWSKSGIHTLSRDQVSLSSSTVNLSDSTIQSFLDDIPVNAKVQLTAVYDSFTKKIGWLYSTTTSDPDKFNGVLWLDIQLQAFYPWRFEEPSTGTKDIVGWQFFEGYNSILDNVDVVVDGDQVQVDGDDVFIEDFVLLADTLPKVIFLVRDENDSLVFADTVQYGFFDWDTTDFSSYAEAAFDFMGDMTIDKSGLYITPWFRVTETGFQGDEVSGYTPLRPSSCTLKYYWDTRTTPSNGANGKEVYRLSYNAVVDPLNLSTFNYPRTTVASANRIRGQGRTLKVRFESTEGKDWHLLGYETVGLKHDRL